MFNPPARTRNSSHCPRFRVVNIVGDVKRECLRTVVEISISGKHVLREFVSWSPSEACRA